MFFPLYSCPSPLFSSPPFLSYSSFILFYFSSILSRPSFFFSVSHFPTLLLPFPFSVSPVFFRLLPKGFSIRLYKFWLSLVTEKFLANPKCLKRQSDTVTFNRQRETSSLTPAGFIERTISVNIIADATKITSSV